MIWCIIIKTRSFHHYLKVSAKRLMRRGKTPTPFPSEQVLKITVLWILHLPNRNILPHRCKGARLRCFVYHYGQPSNKPTSLCTNCLEAINYKRKCLHSFRCEVCKGRHSLCDDTCDHYTPKLCLSRGLLTPYWIFPMRNKRMLCYAQIVRTRVLIRESCKKWRYSQSKRSSVGYCIKCKTNWKTNSYSTCFKYEKFALMTK